MNLQNKGERSASNDTSTYYTKPVDSNVSSFKYVARWLKYIDLKVVLVASSFKLITWLLPASSGLDRSQPVNQCGHHSSHRRSFNQVAASTGLGQHVAQGAGTQTRWPNQMSKKSTLFAGGWFFRSRWLTTMCFSVDRNHKNQSDSSEAINGWLINHATGPKSKLVSAAGVKDCQLTSCGMGSWKHQQRYPPGN